MATGLFWYLTVEKANYIVYDIQSEIVLLVLVDLLGLELGE